MRSRWIDGPMTQWADLGSGFVKIIVGHVYFPSKRAPDFAQFCKNDANQAQKPE
jgi:hypothetical protein